MIPLPSKIEGLTSQLYQLEQVLKPLGYNIGGNWDYDHGYFDYKIDDEVGYQFLRVPFEAVDGQLDSHGVTVNLGRPFLLSHKYQIGLEDHVQTDMDGLSATIDQFQEPEDPDASFPEKYIDLGKALVGELEAVLIE
ncbi:YugN-like family protein [Litchfieldia salsa]|uniref:YugN-like family protein n=1 Tax=Litchfieldia salsa TaxID=930152 RepID=A0A1H0WZ58_9BACI|nr:YugN-like family protein [Litchfieldia salsa]SDP95735.1 YugN-like family protein [Litchfieldia salsa]